MKCYFCNSEAKYKLDTGGTLASDYACKKHTPSLDAGFDVVELPDDQASDLRTAVRESESKTEGDRLVYHLQQVLALCMSTEIDKPEFLRVMAEAWDAGDAARAKILAEENCDTCHDRGFVWAPIDTDKPELGEDKYPCPDCQQVSS